MWNKYFFQTLESRQKGDRWGEPHRCPTLCLEAHCQTNARAKPKLSTVGSLGCGGKDDLGGWTAGGRERASTREEGYMGKECWDIHRCLLSLGLNIQLSLWCWNSMRLGERITVVQPLLVNSLSPEGPEWRNLVDHGGIYSTFPSKGCSWPRMSCSQQRLTSSPLKTLWCNDI